MIGAGIRVHAGVSGAGKTHGIRRDVFAHVAAGIPVAIVDRMREWAAVPPELVSYTAGTHDVEKAVAALASGKRLVIVRPTLADVETATERLAQWACEHKGLAGIAIPEAHRAIPKRLDGRHGAGFEYIASVITEWRHHNIAIWCDTQRFSKLNTDVVELAKHIRLFAMCGKNDMASLRQLGGKELELAVRDCADRMDRGEPGWHVSLGVRRAPPYEVVRE